MSFINTTMILFIAPYPKLKEIADGLIPRYDVPIATVVGDLAAGLEAARAFVSENAILVSRGGTAKLLRDTLCVDVIEIGVSHHDLLRTLKPFIGGIKRVAVVGFRGLTDNAKEICRILDIPAIFLPVDDEHEIPAQIEAVAGMDVECLIGDMVSIRSAGKVGAELHLIESGEAAVAEALEKATIVARSILARRESDLRIRAVFNSVQEGIVSIGRDGIVENANHKACELLGRTDLRGASLESAVPDLDLRRIMRAGRESFGKLVQLNGQRVVANVTPIQIHGKSEGAVAVLQEVGKIQDLEKKVRNQLYLKGFFAKHRFSDIQTVSALMRMRIEIARQYAQSMSSIVIYGETGTGKELFAQSIHNESQVRDGPFVALNCGALPPTLLESELFGYVEGAFTGAVKGGKAGLFEIAHGGTIFLDEINELDIQLQNKLLRVLQEREVMRIGDAKVIPISVRIVVASNIPLRDEIRRGRIRKDLFYRLNVLDIIIPPLRERTEDILYLFATFVDDCSCRHKDAPPPIPDSLKESLLCYDWPGNVRELENVAEKFVALSHLQDGLAAAELLTGFLRSVQGEHSCQDEAIAIESGENYAGTLEEIERRAIRSVFESEGENLSRAAKRLDVDRQTLRKKLGSCKE